MKTLLIALSLSLAFTACSKKTPQEKYNEQRMEANKDYQEEVNDARDEMRDANKDYSKDAKDARQEMQDAARERNQDIQDARKDLNEDMKSQD